VLVKNLVENAILHSPPDAVVAVTLGADDLCVRDEGAGIAPEHMQKLFTRFWRGPGRRDSGAGLGLAICAEIAVAHGWNLSARNAEPGAEFVLRFAAAGA
jgi:signal transduction histidine kinase